MHSLNETLWKAFPIFDRDSSLRLDVGGADYPPPFLGVVGDELVEIGAREREHFATQVSKLCLHFRIGKGRVDLLVEHVEYFDRGALGRVDAVPTARLVAR